MALRPHLVQRVPERHRAAILPPLATRYGISVSTATRGSHELVREGVRLAALPILGYYVALVVGHDVQKLTIVQLLPCCL